MRGWLVAGFGLSLLVLKAVAATTTVAPVEESSVLAIPLTSVPGDSTSDLDLQSLNAWLDGVEQRILSLTDLSDPSDLRHTPPPWQVVLYFDAPLSTTEGLRRAAQYLSRETGRLVELGTVEIVLADPRPRVFLETCNDPKMIREALHDLRASTVNAGQLEWYRQRFSESREGAPTSDSASALRDETVLLEQQRSGLLRTLADRIGPRPKLLILVTSGFDLNPRGFYGVTAGGSTLEDPHLTLTQVEVARALAADGWTAVSLAVGPRPEAFDNPLAPLFELERATGGTVLTRRAELAALLTSARQWPIVQIELDIDASAAPVPFSITAGTGASRLGSVQWASGRSGSVASDVLASHHLLEPGAVTRVESNPVLRLLRPPGLTLAGPIRFHTVSGHRRIEHVEFLVDGERLDTAAKPPFSVVLDLGNEVRPRTVTAVAYSRTGRELGRDSLEINMALEPPRITIDELEHDVSTGVLEIAASATAPTGTAPNRVEVYFNEEMAAAFLQPPYRAHIGVERIEPVDVVRVVAHYPDGETVEAARLPGVTGPTEELEVNLVELLAMVTSRDHGPTTELDRTDFVIRQRGKPLPIDQFSRWEELPLTLGLMLDTSDSMTDALGDVRTAGEVFIRDALRDGDEAFVVDFSSLPRLVRHTTKDSELLLQSLTSLDAQGMTALYDAIVYSLQQFKDSSGRRALVVVTDGEDSASYYQPRECVRQARMHGVPIYLIVLGTPPDASTEPYLLRNLMIARRTGGEIFYVSDLDDLTAIYAQVAAELRRQYFLGFNSEHTLTPKELESLEVEVVPKGLSVRTLLASQQRGG